MDARQIDAPWTDDRILEDVEADDKKMLENCWDRAKGHYFSHLKGAKYFMGETLNGVLAKLGVPLSIHGDPDEIDKKMAENRVKVEHRVDYPNDEAWRRGIYVYKNDELAAFISHPIVNTPRLNPSKASRIIQPGNNLVIWTNAHEVTKLFSPAAN